jgi:hypothetical protein
MAITSPFALPIYSAEVKRNNGAYRDILGSSVENRTIEIGPRPQWLIGQAGGLSAADLLDMKHVYTFKLTVLKPVAGATVAGQLLSASDVADILNVYKLAIRLTFGQQQQTGGDDKQAIYPDTNFKIYAGQPDSEKYGFSNFSIITDPGDSTKSILTFDFNAWDVLWYPKIDPDTYAVDTRWSDNTYTDVDETKPRQILTAVKPEIQDFRLQFLLGGEKAWVDINTLYTRSTQNALVYEPIKSYRIVDSTGAVLVAPPAGFPTDNVRFNIGDITGSTNVIQFINKYVQSSKYNQPLPDPDEVHKEVFDINTQLVWGIANESDVTNKYFGLQIGTDPIDIVQSTTNSGGILSSLFAIASGSQAPITKGSSRSFGITLTGNLPTDIKWSVAGACNYEGVAYSNSSLSYFPSPTTTAGSNTLVIQTGQSSVGTHYIELIAQKDDDTGNPGVDAIFARAFVRVVVTAVGYTYSGAHIGDGISTPLNVGWLRNNDKSSPSNAHTVTLRKFVDNVSGFVEYGEIKLWVAKGNDVGAWTPLEWYPHQTPGLDEAKWNGTQPIVENNIETYYDNRPITDIVCFQYTPNAEVPSNIIIKSIPLVNESQSVRFYFNTTTECSTSSSTTDTVGSLTDAPKTLTITDTSTKVLYYQFIQGQRLYNASLAATAGVGFSYEYCNVTTPGGVFVSDGVVRPITVAGTAPIVIPAPAGVGDGVWYIKLNLTIPSIPIGTQVFNLGCTSAANNQITLNDTRAAGEPTVYWPTVAAFENILTGEKAPGSPFMAEFRFGYSNMTPSNPAVNYMKLLVAKPDAPSVFYPYDDVVNALCDCTSPTTCISSVTNDISTAPGGVLVPTYTDSDANLQYRGVRFTLRTCIDPATSDQYRYKVEVYTNGSHVVSKDITFIFTLTPPAASTKTLEIRSEYNSAGVVLTTNPNTADQLSNNILAASKLSNKTVLVLKDGATPLNGASYTLQISPTGIEGSFVDLSGTTLPPAFLNGGLNATITQGSDGQGFYTQVQGPSTYKYTYGGVTYSRFYLRYKISGSDFSGIQVINLAPCVVVGDAAAATAIKLRPSSIQTLKLFAQGIPTSQATSTVLPPEISIEWPSILRDYTDAAVPQIVHTRSFASNKYARNFTYLIEAGTSPATDVLTIKYTIPSGSEIVIQQIPVNIETTVTVPSLVVNGVRQLSSIDPAVTNLAFVFDTPPATDVYVVYKREGETTYSHFLWTSSTATPPGITLNGLFNTAGLSTANVARVLVVHHKAAADFGNYDTKLNNGSTTDKFDYIYTTKNATVILDVGLCKDDLNDINTTPPLVTNKAFIAEAVLSQAYNSSVIVSNLPTAGVWKITGVTTTATTDNVGWSSATSIGDVKSKLSLSYTIQLVDSTAGTLQFTSGGVKKPGITPPILPNGPETLTFNVEIFSSGKCKPFQVVLPLKVEPTATLNIGGPNTLSNITLCDLFTSNTSNPFKVYNHATSQTNQVTPSEFYISDVWYLKDGQFVPYTGSDYVKNFIFDSGLNLRTVGSSSDYVISTLNNTPVMAGLGNRENFEFPVFPATTEVKIKLTAKFVEGVTTKYGYKECTATVTRPASLSTLKTPKITAHANEAGAPPTCPVGTPVCGYLGDPIKLTFAYDNSISNFTDYKLTLVSNLESSTPTYTVASPAEAVYDTTAKTVIFTTRTGGAITAALQPNTNYALVVKIPQSPVSTTFPQGRSASCNYGYYPSGTTLTANFRYLGTRADIEVADTGLALTYPTNTPVNIPVTHTVRKGILAINKVRYERKLSTGEYTPISAELTPDKNIVQNQISYTLPSQIFNSTSATQTAPSIFQEYRITFVSSSGNSTAKLTITPSETDVKITPEVCETDYAVGGTYTKPYAIECNICSTDSLASTLWSLPVDAQTDNNLFSLQNSAGATTTVLSAAPVSARAYTYKLRAVITMPDGSQRQVERTCRFTGTTAFTINSTLPDTYVGQDYTRQLTTINDSCVDQQLTKTVSWSMGASSVNPQDYPTGLNLTLSESGALTWAPVQADPNVGVYPKTYTINVVAQLRCGTAVVATVNKDLTLKVNASAVDLTSMEPNYGYYDAYNEVTFTGSGFIEASSIEEPETGTRIFFDNYEAYEVQFINSGSLLVKTPKIPQPDAAVELVTRVTIINPDGGTLNPGNTPVYTFRPQLSPVVKSVTPYSGTPLGWTKVTLKGRNFEPFSQVFMSEGVNSDPTTDKLQPIVYITPEEIVFLTLPHAAGNAEIRVTNRDVDAGYITYTFREGPRVSEITPSIISSEGNTLEVYITGYNLYNVVVDGIETKPRIFIDDYEIPSEFITVVQS